MSDFCSIICNMPATAACSSFAVPLSPFAICSCFMDKKGYSGEGRCGVVGGRGSGMHRSVSLCDLQCLAAADTVLT